MNFNKKLVSLILCIGLLVSCSGQGANRTVVSGENSSSPSSPSATKEEGSELGSGRVINVQALTGDDIKVISNSNEVKSFVGQRLKGGDSIKTGASSTATILMDEEKVLVLDYNTEIMIEKAEGSKTASKTVVFLKRGSVLNSLPKLEAQSSYAVKTSNATMGVRGTIVSVSTGDGDNAPSTFGVVEGRVEVTNDPNANPDDTTFARDGVKSIIIEALKQISFDNETFDELPQDGNLDDLDLTNVSMEYLTATVDELANRRDASEGEDDKKIMQDGIDYLINEIPQVKALAEQRKQDWYQPTSPPVAPVVPPVVPVATPPVQTPTPPTPPVVPPTPPVTPPTPPVTPPTPPVPEPPAIQKLATPILSADNNSLDVRPTFVGANFGVVANAKEYIITVLRGAETPFTQTVGSSTPFLAAANLTPYFGDVTVKIVAVPINTTTHANSDPLVVSGSSFKPFNDLVGWTVTINSPKVWAFNFNGGTAIPNVQYEVAIVPSTTAFDVGLTSDFLLGVATPNPNFTVARVDTNPIIASNVDYTVYFVEITRTGSIPNVVRTVTNVYTYNYTPPAPPVIPKLATPILSADNNSLDVRPTFVGANFGVVANAKEYIITVLRGAEPPFTQTMDASSPFLEIGELTPYFGDVTVKIVAVPIDTTTHANSDPLVVSGSTYKSFTTLDGLVYPNETSWEFRGGPLFQGQTYTVAIVPSSTPFTLDLADSFICFPNDDTSILTVTRTGGASIITSNVPHTAYVIEAYIDDTVTPNVTSIINVYTYQYLPPINP